MFKKISSFLLLLGVVFGGTLAFATAAEKESRKIVVFQEGSTPASRDKATERSGGKKVKDLKLVNGQAVILTPGEEELLKNNPLVVYVEEDVIVSASGKKPSPVPPPQTLPWGIARIHANDTWGSTTGAFVKVGIIDTGISLSHPDLAANVKGGVNTISPTRSPEDDNGHGSHVAGTIAAVNNSIGVVGGAPSVHLYAIKSLNRNGSGYLSDIIEGLDWAITNDMDVVNMSLGSSVNSVSFATAVARVHAAGIIQVAAAGNDGGAVSYPARYPEVVAVSATNSSDALASWSNRGPEVDFAAPGVSVYSTYKGSSYATLSGTSMASPHVAAVFALLLATPVIPAYDLDLDGTWDEAEAVQRLKDTADDLGVVGFDHLYGNGLPNALSAITI